jgi:ribosomal protein L32
VKLHILADKKTGKIKGFRVTSEKTRDNAKFVPMVKEVSKTKKSRRRVAKVYADAAYDPRANFNLLKEIGAEPAIKLRKNARRYGHALSVGCQGSEVGSRQVGNRGLLWIRELAQTRMLED